MCIEQSSSVLLMCFPCFGGTCGLKYVLVGIFVLGLRAFTFVFGHSGCRFVLVYVVSALRQARRPLRFFLRVDHTFSVLVAPAPMSVVYTVAVLAAAELSASDLPVAEPVEVSKYPYSYPHIPTQAGYCDLMVSPSGRSYRPYNRNTITSAIMPPNALVEIEEDVNKRENRC